MITDTHIRMARAALKWTVEELADKAQVGKNTVWRIEAGASSNPSTIAAIQRALEDAGVQFIEIEGCPAVVAPRKR